MLAQVGRSMVGTKETAGVDVASERDGADGVARATPQVRIDARLCLAPRGWAEGVDTAQLIGCDLAGMGECGECLIILGESRHQVKVLTRGPDRIERAKDG